MKRLLSNIAILIIMTIGWVMMDKCERYNSDVQHSATVDKEVVMAIDPEESDDSGNEENHVYYGDTLYQYNAKTVVIDYSDMDSDFTSMSSSQIVTYIDTMPVSRSKVIGNGHYFVDGPIIKFAIGVDTVRYDLRNLPKTLNPGKVLFPDNVIEHKFSRRFALSDSSWSCDFKFLAYLPENHPVWIKQFIAAVMRNDIRALYHDNKGAERILKEYYEIKSTPKKIGGINAAGMTPKEIAKHFALGHERLYKDKFYDKECGVQRPKYDYMMEVSPAWISKDGSYITYRFYTCWMN